jgi:hypothetical protein
LKPEFASEVTAEAGASATDTLEVSGNEPKRVSTSTDNLLNDKDVSPTIALIGSNAELHQIAVRRAKFVAALKAKSEARLVAERIAKETAERLAMLEDVCVVETVVPIITGAAKSGRYAVCASTLAKLPRMSYDVHNKLLTSVVRAVANFAAKCTDAASFNLVLRALLVLSYGRVQVATQADTVDHKAMLQWQAVAIVCNDGQCDAALPLQQFAELVHLQCMRSEQPGFITAAQDASVSIVSARMVEDMWYLPYDSVKQLLHGH